MRFTMHRSELMDALSAPSKIALKAQVDYLACILVSVKGGLASFMANDMTNAAVASRNAFVEDEGRCLVPAKALTQSVKALPDEAVEAHCDGRDLKVRAGKATFSIRTLDPDLLPVFPMMEDAESFKVPSVDIANLVSGASYAASKDDSRPELCALRLRSENGSVRLISCDSYRIASDRTTLAVPDFEVLVPVGFLDDAAKEGDVTISTNGRQLRMAMDGLTKMTRAIEGSYPKVDAMWPETFTCEARVDVDDLRGAAKRAMAVSGSSALEVSLSDGAISFKRRKDGESLEDEIAAEVSGDPVAINVNAGYLLDAVTRFFQGKATIKVASPFKPLVIESGTQRALIMPVRVS